jgi:Protein of unknown function (DUF2788)
MVPGAPPTERKTRMFGFTEAQISDFGLTFGLGGMMLYMLFIIGELAYRSKAGKLGTFALFFALGMGIFSFAIKNVLERVLNI